MNKLILFLSACLVASCIKSSHDYAHFESIKGQKWSYSDTLKFAYKPSEDEKLRISLSVRYQKEYEFSNLWVKITDRDGVSRVDIPLFDAEGVPLGKCSSGLCTQTISWKDIDAGSTDTLYFSVVQNMRKEPLELVSDFGMIIDVITDQ